MHTGILHNQLPNFPNPKVAALRKPQLGPPDTRLFATGLATLTSQLPKSHPAWYTMKEPREPRGRGNRCHVCQHEILGWHCHSDVVMVWWSWIHVIIWGCSTLLLVAFDICYWQHQWEAEWEQKVRAAAQAEDVSQPCKPHWWTFEVLEVDTFLWFKDTLVTNFPEFIHVSFPASVLISILIVYVY